MRKADLDFVFDDVDTFFVQLLILLGVYDRYCRQASADETRRIYDVLASGDEPRIKEVIGQITQQVPTDQ